MRLAAQHYTAVAIVLHWAIAIAIAGMIALGWWMGDALGDPATQGQAFAAFQLHKSIGLCVLALSVLRLVWRLANPAPPLPEGMKPWERTAASATHLGFYALILLMPLTGWLYVSTAWSSADNRPLDVPTVWFGLFTVPHIFGLSHLADEARRSVAGVLEFSHSKLAWAAIALTLLHVGAALKHQFVDRDGVLARMVPVLDASGPRSAGRSALLWAGLAATALAAGAAVWSFANPPQGVPAPAAQTQAGVPPIAAAPAEVTPQTQTLPAATDAPPVWRVDHSASRIMFAGVHAGVPFEGRFARWRADIRFDADHLDASSVVVTVETASAADGVPVHDAALPGAEWFDASAHPTAVFRSTGFRTRGNGAYTTRGVLTLKGRAFNLDLPFTLRIDGDRATVDGTAQIDRTRADLGMESDPDAEYVSRSIDVRVHVEARRAQ